MAIARSGYIVGRSPGKSRIGLFSLLPSATSTTCRGAGGCSLLGIGRCVAGVADHVRGGCGVSRRTSGRTRCTAWHRAACRRTGDRCSSCCVSGYGSGAGLAHADLAARPSTGRFDCLPRAIVVGECRLEVGQDALGAVGGPGSLCPVVPHQGFFGALLPAEVCHGYPSVRLQVRQGRMMIPMSRDKI